MKKLPLLIILSTFYFSNQYISQAQELIFSEKIGSSTVDSFSESENSIAIDNNDNLFITGTIGIGSSGATFGEGQVNETTIYINGSYLAKYNANQELLWVEQMGKSTNGITSYGVDTDSDGNAYITGKFFNETTLGEGQTNETILSGTSGEIFIAKYSADGNLLWAINEGGNGDDASRAIKVDSNGNIYVTGSFSDTVIFGENHTTLTSNENDIFLAKYDTNGSLLWVEKSGGSFNDSGKKIDIDKNGNVILTGNYFNSAIFGEGLSNEITLNDSNESGFISKYTSDGDFIWAIEPFSSGTSDSGNDVRVNSDDSILFTGVFFNTITLGGGTINELELSGSGGNEIILAKYSSEGEFLWAKTAESEGDDKSFAITVDSSSNIYITGYYGNEIRFGVGESNETIMSHPSSGYGNLFVSKFSPSGEFIWSTSSQSSSWNQGNDIEVDKEGGVYTSGYYTETITFGFNETNETILSVNDPNDTFVSKFQKETTVLGLDNASIKNKFTIFPNPISNELNIVSLSNEKEYRIEIFSSKGNLVYSSNINNNFKKPIDLSYLDNGFYFIKMTSKGKSEFKKFVKHKINR